MRLNLPFLRMASGWRMYRRNRESRRFTSEFLMGMIAIARAIPTTKEGARRFIGISFPAALLESGAAAVTAVGPMLLVPLSASRMFLT